MKKIFYAFATIIVGIVMFEVVFEQVKRNSPKAPLISAIVTGTDKQAPYTVKTVKSVSSDMLDQSTLEVNTRILDQKAKDYVITQDAKVRKVLEPLSGYSVRLSPLVTVLVAVTSTTKLMKASSYEVDGNNYIVGMTFAPITKSDLKSIIEGSKVRISYFEKQYSLVKPIPLVKLDIY